MYLLIHVVEKVVKCGKITSRKKCKHFVHVEWDEGYAGFEKYVDSKYRTFYEDYFISMNLLDCRQSEIVFQGKKVDVLGTVYLKPLKFCEVPFFDTSVVV